MKSPMLTTLALLSMATMLLTGCGADEEKSKTENQPTLNKVTEELGVFLDLHKQYCEDSYPSRQALVSALEADERFKAAVGFSGVYETDITGVNYAVSPEIDGCTTDVLVKNKATGKLLFSYEQINDALLQYGYLLMGEKITRKYVGEDQLSVTMLRQTYLSPVSEVTNLDYPADLKDQYYMTLFAKKFDPISVLPKRTKH